MCSVYPTSRFLPRTEYTLKCSTLLKCRLSSRCQACTRKMPRCSTKQAVCRIYMVIHFWAIYATPRTQVPLTNLSQLCLKVSILKYQNWIAREKVLLGVTHFQYLTRFHFLPVMGLHYSWRGNGLKCCILLILRHTFFHILTSLKLGCALKFIVSANLVVFICLLKWKCKIITSLTKDSLS